MFVYLLLRSKGNYRPMKQNESLRSFFFFSLDEFHPPFDTKCAIPFDSTFYKYRSGSSRVILDSFLRFRSFWVETW